MFKDTPAFSSFSTNDINKAREFYGQTLGLELEELTQPMPMFKLSLAGGGEVLVYPKDDHVAATFTVLSFTVADVDKAVDELIAKGVTFELVRWSNEDRRQRCLSRYGHRYSLVQRPGR